MKFNLYGLMIGLGVLAAFRASEWLAVRRKIDKKLIENGFWWVLIGGIVGARLYHVVDFWDKLYKNNPLQIIKVWEGGLGIWGAILGGVTMLLGYYVIRLRKKIDLLNLLDVAFIGLPLGQAIGRWGNFFNNEIVGKKGEPLFLYESVLDLVLFGILVLLAGKIKKTGVIAGAYLVGYGVIRFVLEPLRPDEIVWKIGSMPTASLVSVLAVVAGGVLVFNFGRKTDRVQS